MNSKLTKSRLMPLSSAMDAICLQHRAWNLYTQVERRMWRPQKEGHQTKTTCSADEVKPSQAALAVCHAPHGHRNFASLRGLPTREAYRSIALVQVRGISPKE